MRGSILHNRADAEDAVQQAALKGFERIGQYDEARPFKGWWFAILRNGCIDALRQSKAALHRPLDGVDPPAPEQTEESDWRGLNAALARLSAPHQEILRLKYFGELSYADLAQTLSIPAGTVMSRLYLARKTLAQRLEEDLP